MPRIKHLTYEYEEVISSNKKDYTSHIRSLNIALNRYKYGIVVNGYAIDDDNKINWNDYLSLSKDEFETHKIGCCWDYVMYEHYWFDKKDIPHKLFYIEGGQFEETHTFLVYENKGKHILFESSWKSKCGIYEFNTEQELLNYYCSEFIKNFGNKYARYVLYEYKQPKTGLNAYKFMATILKTGKMIRNVGRYYETVIKPWENINFINIDNSAHMQRLDYRWTDELKIIESLPEEDKLWFHTSSCPRNIIGRFIYEDDNKNLIGFVDVLRLVTAHGYSKNIGYIAYAIKPEYRGKGYSKFLLNVAIRIALENKLKELQYRVDNNNIASLRAVQHSKLFKLKKEFKTEKIYYYEL